MAQSGRVQSKPVDHFIMILGQNDDTAKKGMNGKIQTQGFILLSDR